MWRAYVCICACLCVCVCNNDDDDNHYNRHDTTTMPDQGFAKAYRKMQLSSSLFAVAVVQIKPNLETVLQLPLGSLTKELELYNELMRLFVEYNIPSDLLSFDDEHADTRCSVDVVVRVQQVKRHVVRTDM